VEAKLRIGGVPYGVGAPLLEGLESDPEVELARIPPARLVDDLRTGALHCALVSSIEAFRRPGYRVVDGLSIASRGPARSVRAFRRSGRIRTIGLDSGSATTVVLLQILLRAGRLGEHDEDFVLETIAPTTRPDDLPHDLVMLIGDCGLAATTTAREAIDLGACWHQWTGLPFVFAVWLLTGDAPADRIVPRLHEARRRATAAGVDDGTGGAIYYTLGTAELAGLRRFQTEAAALSLCDGALEPEFIKAGPDCSS
jgi:chorismate dehydratase